MKEGNIIQEKSYKFSLRVIGLYNYLVREKREYVMSKQTLRCGTSIGANVEEAIGGHSRADFSAKITIAYKEARETLYWLKLLRDSGTVEKVFINSLIIDCEEICKIVGKIQYTCNLKNNL
jgi:four helix bundle protein